MKKTTILTAAAVLVLLLASCNPAEIGDALKKTGGNIFSGAVTADTSSAAETSAAAASAVNKEEGTLTPAGKEEKAAFVASVSETVARATASEVKQAALEKELKKPVDEETKAIMHTSLPALNAGLEERGIETSLELPENPTVMNLIVMQMLTVVNDISAEETDEETAVAETAAAALKTVEVISGMSKAGRVDILAIALPFISDIIGTKAIAENQISDDAAKYARMMISVFDEMIRASDSDGDTYLDAAGLSEALFALKAKRIAYESAGTAVYDSYLPEEEERTIYYPGWAIVKALPEKAASRRMTDVFEKMLENPSGTFSLGNLLDYAACVAMTEFESVFGSPLDSMLTKASTDAIRKYLADPTKANLADLVNLDEFSGFMERMDDFDFGRIINNTTVRKTACVMTADVAVETFSDIIRDILKEEN